MLDFFISSALANPPAPQPTGMDIFFQFLPLIILFLVFYFIIIRPQQKRVREHTNLINNLKKGDEVVTNGGVLGKVAEVHDAFITLEIAENVKVNVQRQMITNLMPKGTIKNL